MVTATVNLDFAALATKEMFCAAADGATRCEGETHRVEKVSIDRYLEKEEPSCKGWQKLSTEKKENSRLVLDEALARYRGTSPFLGSKFRGSQGSWRRAKLERTGLGLACVR